MHRISLTSSFVFLEKIGDRPHTFRKRSKDTLPTHGDLTTSWDRRNH